LLHLVGSSVLLYLVPMSWLSLTRIESRSPVTLETKRHTHPPTHPHIYRHTHTHICTHARARTHTQEDSYFKSQNIGHDQMPADLVFSETNS